MMAKMFYTLEETKSTLGKNEEEIKQLTREGRLREFRDGPRLMFKADQVDNLKSELGSASDQINLGPSDSGAPIGLVDSRSGSGAVVSLADSTAGSSPTAKEDTALAADLGLSGAAGMSGGIGLSGSVGGMPSPARPGAGSGLSGLSGTSQGSKSGINLLGDDGSADPSAQTAINPAISDQLNVEGMGSGSGLLDLTRESDNTSLGAVLDELPGGRHSETSAGTSAGAPSGLSSVVSSAPAPRVISQPQYVEAKDPMASAFGGMAFGAALTAIFGIWALTAGVLSTQPTLLHKLQGQQLYIIAAGGVGVAVIGFIIGAVLGKVKA